jgi:hypothetical protein
VILQNPNVEVSSLAIALMGATVPHKRQLMMGETAHELGDFSWICKGWKIFNKKHSGKTNKIDFSQQLLDKSQFYKRKSILHILIGRIDVPCIMIQWLCSCMNLMVKVSVFTVS